MKLLKLSLIFLLALPLFITSCGDDDETMEPEVMSIVEIATGDDQFSTLVSALQRVDLVSVLEGAGPFTVFAPLNSAFEAISATTATLDADQLSKVLLYHVASGNVVSSAIMDGMEVTILNSDVKFTINADGSTVTLTDEGGNTSEVVLTDVQGTNGVIHVISAVIISDNL